MRLARARKAAGLTQEELAYRVGVDRSTVGRWEAGETDPQPWVRRKLAKHLGVTPAHLDGLLGAEPPAPPDDDGEAEAEALELVRRVSASDVGETTLAQLEQLVDDLASSYATTQPAVLLVRTRQHLRYVGQLLEGRKTLREHRRLLDAGGWLSLLAATLHVDLEQQAAAVARLRTADSLARESGHDEIRAWALETSRRARSSSRPRARRR
jgi:transcriptional regulator with XRE-family HTH domain